MKPQRCRLACAALLIAAALAVAGVLWLEIAGGAEFAALFRASQAAIADWTDRHMMPGALAYVAVVALGRVTPFPGAIFLTLSGGFLFGTVLGGALAAAGAALSATLVFAVGRRFFAGYVRARLGRRFGDIEREFTDGALPYLIAMRLLPMLPAWLVNLAPVPFPVRASTVAAATFLGVLPASLVVASVGSGLAGVSAGSAELSARMVLSPNVLLPLSALSLLALLSALARRRLRARNARKRPGVTVAPRRLQGGTRDR